MNIPCQQTVTSCGFAEGEQDNWLITQYISRRVNGTLLPDVSVLVAFELQGCTIGTTNCNSFFAVYIWETSAKNGTAARDTRNYQLVEDGIIIVGDNGFHNETREVAFNSSSEEGDEEEEHGGFYLAIRDTSTCIAINRLLVLYNVCRDGESEGDERLCVGI